MHFHLRNTILTISVILSLSITLYIPALAVASDELNLSAVKAPVAPNGTTVGAPTDFVITFSDPDPDFKGISLRTGDTVEVKLDDAFMNTGFGPNTMILLQGWPQSPPAGGPFFLWTTAVDGNTITATLNQDFKAGQFGPGSKQAHLLLFGFNNPTAPGVYQFELTINREKSKKRKKGKGSKKSKKTLIGTGSVRIIPDARPSVEPISFFSGPPGPPPPFYNPLYQTLELGESARQVGLYLWDADNAPFVGVDIQATSSPTYYQMVDAAAVVVGEIWITHPSGAIAYSLQSIGLAPGSPPSVEVPAFVTGLPVGLLGIQFNPDPWVTGDYEIAISMKNGNEKTLFITVTE
jgi:hypothetical protein